MQNNKRLRTIFYNTLKISACTFGGGFVIVPLLRDTFSKKFNWIEEEEILSLVTIAQSAPGPIAVNASVIIGYKVAGLKGALASLIGTVIPPFVFISVISVFYSFLSTFPFIVNLISGMQIGVFAVIISIALELRKSIKKDKNILSGVYTLIALILINIMKTSVFLIIALCILVFSLQYYLKRKQETCL